MKARMLRHNGWLAAELSMLALAAGLWGAGPAAGADAAGPPEDWPRRADMAPYRIVLYEPSVEAFDQDWMKARSAISVARNDGDPVFGAIWYGLRLNRNAEGTVGRVTGFRLDRMRFPEGVVIERGVIERMLGNNLVNADLQMAPLLASLERERAAAEAAAAGIEAVPDILYTTVPVALVRIDGEPELKEIPNSDLLAVVNSNSTIFLQKGTAQWFLLADNRWMTARAVTGPWEEAAEVPESVRQAAGNPVTVAGQGPPPAIVVVTRSTEVIAVDGEPRYTVIPGTTLLYVNNTTADLFLDIAGQKHYVLLAGRWFATTNLEQGPWEMVPGERLPETFAAIPPECPRYGVLAHVPGTALSQAAVEDTAVPQAQKIKRGELKLTVEYEGEPEFVPAGQTTVYYAVNTPYSVLRVDPYYYLCYDGVWYYGPAAWGPWAVCVSVPGVIYTIPPVCPVYPVTYVRVYHWTPDYVWCGFTAGYLGWYVGWPGLVFGFAYYDDDWWHHHHHPHHGGYWHRYYHHYHCGVYPRHGWDPGPRGWGDGPVHGGPERPPYLRDRPGPELHTAAYRRGGTGYTPPSRIPTAYNRPNRYGQEGRTATLGAKLTDSDEAAAARLGKGRPGAPEPRGPVARDTDARRTVRERPDAWDAREGSGPGKPGLGSDSARRTAPDTGRAWDGAGRDTDRTREPVGKRPSATPTPEAVDRASPGPAVKPVTPSLPRGREPNEDTDRPGKPLGAAPVLRGEAPAERAPAPKAVETGPGRRDTDAAPASPAPSAPGKPQSPADNPGRVYPGKVNTPFFEERYGRPLVLPTQPKPAPVVVPDGNLGAASGSTARAMRSGGGADADAVPAPAAARGAGVPKAPAGRREALPSSGNTPAPKGLPETRVYSAPAASIPGTVVPDAGAASRGVAGEVAEAAGSLGKSLGGTLSGGAKAAAGAVSGAAKGGGRSGGGWGKGW